MGKLGIYWTNQETYEIDYEQEPPYPNFNALAALVCSFDSKYVNEDMINAFLRRYQKACNEIQKTQNTQNEQIWILKNKINALEAELSKWTSHQGKGRQQSKRVSGKESQIKAWRAEGLSKSAIARKLGVSEGTIRRIIKKSENAEGQKNTEP